MQVRICGSPGEVTTRGHPAGVCSRKVGLLIPLMRREYPPLRRLWCVGTVLKGTSEHGEGVCVRVGCLGNVSLDPELACLAAYYVLDSSLQALE